MRERDVIVPAERRSLVSTWSYPDRQCRAGVVALHPSNDPSRNQYLFRALAEQLAAIDIALLRYDRRTIATGRDVPYSAQLADAQRALIWARQQLGDIPVGLWAFSQGAWVAMMAAALDPAIAFLVVVGASAVSPAVQMRYGTDEQLRQAGYDAHARAELVELRQVYEQFQRGELARDAAQSVVDAAASRAWFELSWVPRVLPTVPDWVDMDFDPGDDIGKIQCPVLASYGDDEWIPVEQCLNVWRDRIPDRRQLTIERLSGTTHHPTVHGGRTVESISPQYRRRLASWLLDRI